MTSIAIITARGGSKGVKRKNLRDLCGKPLIAHTIEAALKSNQFEHVIVSSDDAEILSVSAEYGATPITRPALLATDTASSLDVIEHALIMLKDDDHKPDSFCLLQPTSPLRTAEHIKEAFTAYRTQHCASVISVSPTDHHPYKTLILDETGAYKPIHTLQDLTSPRQALPKSVTPNGAIYICDSDLFLQTKNLFHEDTCFYEMTKDQSVDIDTEEDLLTAEKLIKAQS